MNNEVSTCFLAFNSTEDSKEIDQYDERVQTCRKHRRLRVHFRERRKGQNIIEIQS
jgi:hypothetical protein